MPSGIYKHAKGVFKQSDYQKSRAREVHLIHGHAPKRGKESPEYVSWRAMIHRCRNVKATNYKWYGARGIEVCDRWLKFVNFLSDMGIKPTPKHTIERIDHEKGYEPMNCRWATRAEQAKSRRKPKKHVLFERRKA